MQPRSEIIFSHPIIENGEISTGNDWDEIEEMQERFPGGLHASTALDLGKPRSQGLAIFNQQPPLVVPIRSAPLLSVLQHAHQAAKVVVAADPVYPDGPEYCPGLHPESEGTSPSRFMRVLQASARALSLPQQKHAERRISMERRTLHE